MSTPVSSSLDAALRALFQRVFKIAPKDLSDRTRRGSLEAWDSLGHLELLEALRKEFGVEIAPEQALEMETFADVRRVVASLRPGC
ncbi:MAG: acyl carrier protein [Phycisphaerales bacterium]|nr:acyl carrier protein [Phycisphaerales bacterium]